MVQVQKKESFRFSVQKKRVSDFQYNKNESFRFSEQQK